MNLDTRLATFAAIGLLDLSQTPAHRGSLDSAHAEIAQAWRQPRERMALDAGRDIARAVTAAEGSPRAALLALRRAV